MAVFALLERLEREVNLVINSKQETDSLSSKLKKLQMGLQEAERVGVTDKGVRDWLKQLEGVIYEMDDVLDELETTNLQVEEEDTSLYWDKVRTLFLSLCLCFKQVVDCPDITIKMKALSERIDTILTKKGKFGFVSSENDRAQEFKQEKPTSLVSKEFKTYGLKDVKNNLVKKLVLEGEGSDKHTQIISIVGVGGVGKSTLARVVYNDPNVGGLFSPKGWVSVSQAFDALAIAKAILESFGEKSDEDAHNLETLVQRIEKAVNNKRFLLVLDNVWTEDRNKWEGLKSCLDGGKGSRIIVTTRHESVARMMGTTQWQFVGLLSDLDCGTMLNGIALEGRTGQECENLRLVGMEIAKRCNGLPLAATSLGSMLASKSSEQQWRGVLESPLWQDEEKVSDLFRLLNLSYTDLSPLLKRCFLSSVIFPKGTSISIDAIARIWMAYGYLNSNGTACEVQSKGFQYLNSLAMRSFFQRVASDDEYDKTKSYKVQDVMHDFAAYLSGSDEYSFIMDGGLEKEKSSFPRTNLPWISLQKLRTFCVCREEFRPDIISHLTSVRVLSMSDCNLQGLPEDIGKLIHLRYLNVSHNPMSELPETITDLCNLQTLDIERCQNLSSLPQGMEKLISLRHIVNNDAFKMVQFPQGLEKLSGLWTLSEFRGSNLGCLRNLNQLQGCLLLSLENANEKEVVELELWKKQHIKKLVLLFGEEEEVDKVVEALKLPSTLESLEIHSGWVKWLSHWFYTSSFDTLKSVTLYGRGNLQNVPPFGKLPALEELEIFFCRFERLSNEFLGVDDKASSRQVVGGFPRLKKLRLFGCGSWQEWEDIEEECVPVMRCLEKLEIEMCPQLYMLPRNLLGKASALRVVKLSESQSLYRRYNKVSGYDRHNVPLLPNQMWIVQE